MASRVIENENGNIILHFTSDISALQKLSVQDLQSEGHSNKKYKIQSWIWNLNKTYLTIQCKILIIVFIIRSNIQQAFYAFLFMIRFSLLQINSFQDICFEITKNKSRKFKSQQFQIFYFVLLKKPLYNPTSFIIINPSDMNKLYSLAYRRVLNSLSASELSSASVPQILKTNSISSMDSALFFRLPREELKSFVSTPCPITNPENQSDLAVVKAAKFLRSNLSIKQTQVTSKCSLKQKCPCLTQNIQTQEGDALANLLIFMHGINNKAEFGEDLGWKVWTGGYKMSDSLIATIQDLKAGGEQTTQYQTLRNEYTSKKLQQHDQTQSPPGFPSSPLTPQQLSSQISSLYKQRNQKLKRKQYKLFEQQQQKQRQQNYGNDNRKYGQMKEQREQRDQRDQRDQRGQREQRDYRGQREQRGQKYDREQRTDKYQRGQRYERGQRGQRPQKYERDQRREYGNRDIESNNDNKYERNDRNRKYSRDQRPEQRSSDNIYERRKSDNNDRNYSRNKYQRDGSQYDKKNRYDKYDRNQRSFERQDKSQQYYKNNRNQRTQRNDGDKYNRNQRNQRYDRNEKYGRNDKYQRNSQYQRNNKYEKNDRYDKNNRNERKQERSYVAKEQNDFEKSSKVFKQKFLDSDFDFDLDSKFENEGRKYTKKQSNPNLGERFNIEPQKKQENSEPETQRRGRRVRRL